MAPIRFVIDSPEAYERARDRVGEILAASNDGRSPLKAELNALTEACMDWEHATDIGSEANGPIDEPPPISSEAGYRAARARIVDLRSRCEGTAEKRELARLSHSVEAWETNHPPQTGRLDEPRR